LIRKFFEARKLRPNSTCAMALDLRGREIRACPRTLPEEGVRFEMGTTAMVRSDNFFSGASTQTCIQIDNADLPKAIRPGDDISFDCGQLRAVVLECEQDCIKVQFKESGTLRQGGSVLIPGHRLSQLPILRAQDKEDILTVALKNRFDFIIVPNVTSVKDVQEIKYARTEAGSSLAIIAKIDNLEAIHQFEGILKYADGVIVLRNELANELAPEKLMLAQKWMIQTANMAAVPIYLQS
jgi:pyruvate kinase